MGELYQGIRRRSSIPMLSAREGSAFTFTPPDCFPRVAAFVGNCRIERPIPANVTKAIDFVRYIRSFRHRVFADAEVEALVAQIQEARLTANRATRSAHVAQLRARHAGSKESGAPNQEPDRRA